MERPAWKIEKDRMVEGFHELNRACVKGQVVFAGSSLMEGFPIDRWARETPGAPEVYNRGVGGYTTVDLLPRLDACILELAPRKLFINIGTNDLSNPEDTVEDMIRRYEQILTIVREQLPDTVIYVMAYYPINEVVADEGMKACLKIRTNEKIREANRQAEELARRLGLRYIDVNAPLTDEEGRLRAEYTIEGMHIREEGYRSILLAVMQYILE